MTNTDAAYVFDLKALRKVYSERTSNALIDCVAEKAKAEQILSASKIKDELKDIAKEELDFLNGIDGFMNCWVNPPEDIYGMAVVINGMDGGARLDEADQWSLAIANVKKCYFVVERKGKKFQLIKEIARKLPNVRVITYQDFKNTEGI